MLQVWLRGQAAPLLVWQSSKQQWQSVAGWQALKQQFGSQSVCLYFPTLNLQQITSELSAAQLKKLGEAGKQFLFEDTSLTPVENLRIREQKGSQHFLYALPTHDINTWQQSLALSDLKLAALLPDFLLLPPPDQAIGQQVTLYQDAHTCLMRQSQYTGTAVSLLAMSLSRLPHLNEVTVIPSVENQQTSQGTTTKPAASLRAQLVEYKDDLIVSQSHGLPEPITQPERHPLNFYQKVSEHQLSAYLKVTAMVALCALVLQLAADALQWYQYDKALKATKAATAQQYQAWFPEQRLSGVTKLQIQMRPYIRNLQADEDGQLAILSRITPILKQSSVTAQSMQLSNTAVQFMVLAENRSNLDKLTQALNDQGLKTNLGQVVNQEDKVAGQITITLPVSEQGV